MKTPRWRPSARFRLTAMATLIGLSTVLAPMVALADDLINNIDTSVDATREVLELSIDDGATQIRVQPRNGDGENGCNLQGTTEAVVVNVTSSDESVVTLSDASKSLTFSNCDDVRTVTVRPQGNGEANITFTQDSNNAGGSFNLAPANFSVRVSGRVPADTTAPDISYILNPASPDGNNGWYTSDVTLTWTVTEDESPNSLVKTGCDDQNITADQTNQTYSCRATSDGGTADRVDVDIKRDATRPEVAFDLSNNTVADGGAYYFSFVPAKPGCTASDATSGLNGYGDDQKDCNITGDANYDAVGSHTLTAEARDNAGNTRSTDITYDVLAWTLKGFFRPVDMGAVLNTVKGGSTVPLKFEVFAGDLELTDTSIVKNFSVNKVNCASLELSGTDAVEFLTTGGTSLRYDATDGQFVQNWKTPTATGCYVTTMKTQDGSSIEAFFKIK